MWFFNIEATPKPDTEQAGKLGGAYINCWINSQLQDGAELLAKFYIEEAGWTPKQIEDSVWVEKEDYTDGAENLKYYLEAEEEGASFVFHHWPVNGEDEEE